MGHTSSASSVGKKLEGVQSVRPGVNDGCVGVAVETTAVGVDNTGVGDRITSVGAVGSQALLNRTSATQTKTYRNVLIFRLYSLW